MKKIVCGTLLFLLCVTMAFSGGKTEEGEGEIVLTAMVRDYSLRQGDAPWKTAAEELKKKYPNVSIQFEALPYDDQREKVLITVGAGKGPDIVMVDCIWLGEFASNDIIIDLTDRIGEIPGLRDDYLPTFRNSAQWDGKDYGLWLWTDVRMLSYNKDLFRAAGLDPENPPKSWEELIHYAKQLNDPANGVWGYAFPAFSTDHTADRWYPFLYMNGGQILSPDNTEAAFNSPEGVEALELLVELMRKEKVSPPDLMGISEKDVSNGFIAEKYAMMVKVGEFWKDFRDDKGLSMEQYKNKIGVAPLPIPAGGQKATGSGGWIASVTRDSEHPDIAFEYITMVAEASNMVKFLEKQGALPTRESLLEMEDTFEQFIPYFNVAKGVLPYTHFRPPIPEYSKISAEIVDAIQLALAGKTSAKKALDDAAKRVNEILADRKW